MITKRQLGIIVTLVGIVAAAGVVAIDLVGAGEWGGFGPLQRIGVGFGALLVLASIPLIRLGDRPA
jgi:hypothetical protein